MPYQGGKFTDDEVTYLRSLQAVEYVTNNRITYADKFKVRVLREYAAGISPRMIFLRAGLESSILGRKRIERCIARWRKDPRLTALAADGSTQGGAPSRAPLVADLGPARAGGLIAAGDDEESRDPYARLVLGDHRDLVISRQAQHIMRLEAELAQLHAKMGI